ncbi:hypothetical protein B0I72DRAFT_129610 [Yarrowia lipolytica]|uniref:Secreted protein n=1 Tax=Yarrowia lipolytica TaxID=4952 RepID=A0A371C6F3_YARLL|nr:hypothetical protein B0I71DRAFT_140882 [Yarrowia lipolytica]RDW31909.1 hypothetical protein B0I72DRAFT_129610 [Yarrowia lipolytica]RDW38711.1 hypothetical protein B0I73DRAFT_141641 [Yarrowia lipolytica]
MAVSPARTVLLVFLVPASVSASVLSVCHHDPCRGRCSPRRIQLSHETAAIFRAWIATAHAAVCLVGCLSQLRLLIVSGAPTTGEQPQCLIRPALRRRQRH